MTTEVIAERQHSQVKPVSGSDYRPIIYGGKEEVGEPGNIGPLPLYAGPQGLAGGVDVVGELYILFAPAANPEDAVYPPRFEPRPGGAVSPGGGPLAVVNPPLAPGCIPFMPPIGPVPFWPWF